MIVLSQGNLQQLLKLAIISDGNRVRIQLVNGQHLRVEYEKGSGGPQARKMHRRILRLSDSEWVNLG